MIHIPLKESEGILVIEPTCALACEYRAALAYLHYSQVVKGAQLVQALRINRQVASQKAYSEAAGTR